MSRFIRVTQVLGAFFILVLFVAGIFVLTWLVPNLSQLLVDSWSEFENQRNLLQLLLSMPVVFAEALLGLVFYLNMLLLGKRIFDKSVNKWVWALAGSSFGLFISFLVIFRWLDYIGALPPIIAIFLFVSMLLTLALGFIVITLLALLKKATQAVQELEEVI